MKRSNPQNSRRGFTLVELLVVVGIIAVVIAILLPVLAKAREQAHRVKCAANLHTIGQALVVYAQQYRYYPCLNGGPVQLYIWPVRLRPLVGGSQEVFYCPSQDPRCRWDETKPASSHIADVADALFGYSVGEHGLDAWSYFSYGYNAMGASSKIWGGVGRVYDGTHRGLGLLADPPYQPTSPAGHVAMNRVTLPSEMIAIADTTADGRDDGVISPIPDNRMAWPANIHSRGSNVLFCDGHVQWHLQSDLTLPNGFINEPQNLAIRRMWNNNHEPD